MDINYIKWFSMRRGREMKMDKGIHVLNALLIGLILFNIYSYIMGSLAGLNLIVLGSVQIFMIAFMNGVHDWWMTHIEDEDILN